MCRELFLKYLSVFLWFRIEILETRGMYLRKEKETIF